MKTFKLIDRLLSNGVMTHEMYIVSDSIFADNPYLTFDSVFGAVNANGKYGTSDSVPMGLAVYGRENFISVPDAVFQTNDGQVVAWYDYQP